VLLHRHRGMRRVLAHFFAARLAFGAGFELMDAPLLLDDGRIHRRSLAVAPGLAAIAVASVTTISPVAAAAIATSTPMFLALAFRTITTGLLLSLLLRLRGLALDVRLGAFASE
jgi:hypothetical protein